MHEICSYAICNTNTHATKLVLKNEALRMLPYYMDFLITSIILYFLSQAYSITYITSKKISGSLISRFSCLLEYDPEWIIDQKQTSFPILVQYANIFANNITIAADCGTINKLVVIAKFLNFEPAA